MLVSLALCILAACGGSASPTLGDGDPSVIAASLDLLQRAKRITDAAAQYFRSDAGDTPSLHALLEAQHHKAAQRVTDYPHDGHRAARSHMNQPPSDTTHKTAAPEEAARGVVGPQDVFTCADGVAAVPSGDVYACGALGSLSGTQLAALTASEREACSFQDRAVCVCPVDYAGPPVGSTSSCTPQAIACAANVHYTAPTCRSPFSPFALPMERYHCVTVSRLDTLSIGVSLNCITATSLPPTATALVVLGRASITGDYATLANSSDLFVFAVRTPSLALSVGNPALRSDAGLVFVTLYNLNQLSVDIVFNASLSAAALAGNVSTFDVDLSEVPDAYIAGGVIYAEAGLLSIASVFDTFVYAASLFVRVAGPAHKPPSSGSALPAGAIAGIVIGCVAGVALIGYGAWRYRKAKLAKRAMKED